MRTLTNLLLVLVAAMLSVQLNAQIDTTKKVSATPAPAAPAKKEHWYDKLSFRGYTQIRYSRLAESNEDFKLNQDKSVGKNGGFLIRRGRIILSGDVHPRVYIYIQNDFASSSGTTLHYTDLRDAYFDQINLTQSNFLK